MGFLIVPLQVPNVITCNEMLWAAEQIRIPVVVMSWRSVSGTGATQNTHVRIDFCSQGDFMTFPWGAQRIDSGGRVKIDVKATVTCFLALTLTNIQLWAWNEIDSTEKPHRLLLLSEIRVVAAAFDEVCSGAWNKPGSEVLGGIWGRLEDHGNLWSAIGLDCVGLQVQLWWACLGMPATLVATLVATWAFAWVRHCLCLGIWVFKQYWSQLHLLRKESVTKAVQQPNLGLPSPYLTASEWWLNPESAIGHNRHDTSTNKEAYWEGIMMGGVQRARRLGLLCLGVGSSHPWVGIKTSNLRRAY